jgi:hypothetical protein
VLQYGDESVVCRVRRSRRERLGPEGVRAGHRTQGGHAVQEAGRRPTMFTSRRTLPNEVT